MMFFRVISKVVLVVLLGVAGVANAQDKQDLIMCPKLDKIHQAASLMTHTQWCKENYCVVSSSESRESGPAFYEGGLGWWLITVVAASSTDEAILKAQNIATEVSVMGSEVARYDFILSYVCTYLVTSSSHDDGRAIGILALGSDRKPQALIMQSLKKIK